MSPQLDLGTYRQRSLDYLGRQGGDGHLRRVGFDFFEMVLDFAV